jgi:hypothetical protein
MHDIFLARSATHELRKAFDWHEGAVRERKDLLNPGEHFEYESRSCRSLEDVHDLLTELADDPRRSIVAGRPMLARGKRTEVPFEDATTVWWLIDLDGLKLRGTVEETIEHYLPCLAGCSYVYGFSQKAGFADELRVRVIVKVEPTTRAQLRRYAEHYSAQIVAFESLDKKSKPVDPRIYTVNQFIFTARPNLIGIEDPHPVRVFKVDGWRHYPEFPILPAQVQLTFETSRTGSTLPYMNRETGLPNLLNFGQSEADGHLRGDDANKALGRLKLSIGIESGPHIGTQKGPLRRIGS